MDTKSQKYTTTYEVNFDFDASSDAWKANKRYLGSGCYRYLCCVKGKNNNCCAARCLPGKNYCKTHLQMLEDGLL